MADIRTFIAIDLDAAIHETLAAVQQRLRQIDPVVVWVRPEGMHLTLKFLGNIPAGRVPEIAGALEGVAALFPPVHFAVAGAGGFPSARAPRVVWVGIREGAETLGRLAAAVDSALAEREFPREMRPFRAHLTLGRVKYAPPAALTTELDRLSGTVLGEMTATGMQLMRSDLSAQGARYTVLRQIPFTAAG